MMTTSKIKRLTLTTLTILSMTILGGCSGLNVNLVSGPMVGGHETVHYQEVEPIRVAPEPHDQRVVVPRADRELRERRLLRENFPAKPKKQRELGVFDKKMTKTPKHNDYKIGKRKPKAYKRGIKKPLPTGYKKSKYSGHKLGKKTPRRIGYKFGK